MRPSSFMRHATHLFLALRAADAVNVAAGAWIVPKFVRAADLGAVLPLVTFATTLATPAFAFAFVLMRESNRLAADRAFGQLKSLLAGAFVTTAALIVLTLAATSAFIPQFSAEMNADASAVAFVALAAAFLGSFAPVYQDALNGLKRFGIYGLSEIAAALARVGTMLAVAPFNALLGFFCGNAAQPLARIGCAVFALRRELNTPAEPYWTRPVIRRLALTYVGVFFYLLAPMVVSLLELSLVRTLLPPEVSGAYYLETRLTDLLGYLTLPILLVMFPIAAETARAGKSTRTLVGRCTLASATGALALGLAYAFCGRGLLSLFPNAAQLTFGVRVNGELLALLAINLTGAFQTFYTNAEIAAGRCRFLAWFIPLHLAYLLLLLSPVTIAPTLPKLITVFATFGIVRALFVLLALRLQP